MRTNIEIDDKLMTKVMCGSGVSSKREAVEIAMKSSVRLLDQQAAFKKLNGMGGWEGDLKQSRLGRNAD